MEAKDLLENTLEDIKKQVTWFDDLAGVITNTILALDPTEAWKIADAISDSLYNDALHIKSWLSEQFDIGSIRWQLLAQCSIRRQMQ